MTPSLRSLGSSASQRLGRSIGDYRRWRWRQLGPERIGEVSGYRTPVQVCPRGCEYHELARRDLLTRTRISGRVEVRAVFTFETTNCHKCGSRLARKCARCDNEIFAPVVDRCQFCGLPQPWAADRRAAAERSSLRLWHPDSEGVHDAARGLYRVEGRGDLWVVEGDITRLKADAVISNDDVDGQMWAEVARAIKNAAGEEIEQRAQDGKPYRPGDAWLTGPGGMSSSMKGVIHVASMNRRGESSLEIVRACLVSALGVAAEEGYESIGLGAFGSGPRAIDDKDWYRTFVQTMVSHLTGDGPPAQREEDEKEEEEDAHTLSIVLVLFEPQDFDETRAFLLQEVRNTHGELDRPGWGRLGSPTDDGPVWE